MNLGRARDEQKVRRNGSGTGQSLRAGEELGTIQLQGAVGRACAGNEPEPFRRRLGLKDGPDTVTIRRMEGGRA